MMTVGELIERLQEYDENLPVTIVHQPNYPLEDALRTVADNSETEEQDEDGNPTKVYIVAGENIGYGPRL